MSVYYPVHVEAELDPRLSRWLWLVKWVLAVPHYVVLAFLWLAFAVTSVLAFFGILFTGRYPRSLFDFNVGVLRWSWRVAYYAYGALGTDRYPPFSLRDVPDYPAHLAVDYPEHLSRGLVLVKWWLLAIPHYIVLGIFLGGAGYAIGTGEHAAYWGSGGLIGLMVCIAAVVLLFTGTYPGRIFDLVLGLNRWVLRVAGYVALMTDRYPPFALDQGGHEDGSVATLTPPAAAPAPVAKTPAVPVASERQEPRGWSAGRVVSLVAGALVALAAVAMLLAAALVGIAGATARDADGFLMSPTRSLASPGYAVTTQDLSVQSDVPGLPHRLLGDTKIRATPTNGKAVFIGIARTSVLAGYLGSARHSVLRSLHQGTPRYDVLGLGRVTAPPGAFRGWAASESGIGTRSLVWHTRTGHWTAVLMNADATPGVRADAAIGAELPALPWLVGGLAVGGLLIGAVAAVLILVPTRQVARELQARSGDVV
ncbi:MAG: DUF4389 domain-containing protein [Nocardioides sp.]